MFAYLFSWQGQGSALDPFVRTLPLVLPHELFSLLVAE